MELRYLKGKTQMEVAKEIGISQAQVSVWKRPHWGSSEPGKNNKTGVQSPERADRAPVYCDIFRESVDIYGG